ncbi:trehalose-phosphatase [Halobacteriales archaeon QS_1_67_19]|nr:MAG: trehalose-phosphatase [Halobacteriales archaeon QS_1_67_19]
MTDVDAPTGDASETDEGSRGSDPPESLRDHLHALVTELIAREGLLVALDFDGTLAAIEDRPEQATIPEPTREAVAVLAAEPDVAVAVVSGRELADVRERVGLPELAYAGNHGLEIRADEYAIHPEARSAEATIEDVCDRLAGELADVEGAIVERKGVTATIHHRLVDDEAVPTVERGVESAVADREEVRLTTGKDVLELRPAVEWNKGEAVRELTAELVPDGEDWLPIYLGDDTTDEAAFAVLDGRGLGVKVGDDPDTDAPYRVADPEAVREVLAWLGEYGLAFLRTDSRDVPAAPE